MRETLVLILACNANPPTFKGHQERPRSLVYAAFRCFLWPLIVAIPPRLALIGFSYSQPFLINRIITFVDQPPSVTSINNGYGLMGATGVIYVGLAVITLRSLHYSDGAYSPSRYPQQFTSIRFIVLLQCSEADWYHSFIQKRWSLLTLLQTTLLL